MNYPWKHISPKDTLQVTQSTILSNLDSRIIASLYQPLAGVQAISLYMLLKETSETCFKADLMLSDVLTQLNIGIKEFYEARIRLEAYGLLKVYQHTQHEDAYVLFLQPPLSAEGFFNEPLLKMSLVEKVGERVAGELEKRFVFKPEPLKDYKEITKSFIDVIHVDMEKVSQAISQKDNQVTDRKEKLSEQVVRQSHFDWSFFMEGLNKQFVKSESLDSNIKQLIYTFHTLYGINELDMQHFVLESADISTGEVSESKLTHLIQKQFLNSGKTTTFVRQGTNENDQNESHRMKQLKQKGFSKEEIEIILHAEKTQPYAYLKSIKEQKGGFVSSNETWLLKELVEQAPIPISVLNILINYVLIIKNSPTLEKNFALKIANDWSQSNIESPEDAMNKVKELYAEAQAKQFNQSKRSPNKRYSTKERSRVETLPDWASKKETTDERISKEEEEAFREKLRRIRNRKGGENEWKA